MAHRMDVVWVYPHENNNADGLLRFKKMTMIAKLVLTLPNFEAAEERVVFSMVTKSKTFF